ncbi:hypothetical protein MPTK1_4g24000 [Marchantia polymorpha subsp. ruderalis]|uniref:Uncharacterized protein n=2 Tax=Marchantia polymorpha TaxID=3197 RepID=A0AAF6BD69_MARPO|nr:hypothetical protein MARPO_0020s0159 [Marchantia polymorpha]BBN09953.1 hypothetical protein Mp_4g24000 [Marchantia polymorpha subsp. ruderalis]|eukprot:PTQ44527.1 hypothetical protein MARPO_0020s0159 [Marchantia polymorpha]
MQSAQEAREARRRKILARGADRLAYITGELPAISTPSPTTSSSSSFAAAEAPTSSVRSGDAALIRLVDSGSSVPRDGDASSDLEYDIKSSTRVLKDVREQLAALELQDREPGQKVKLVPVSQLTISKPSESASLTLADHNHDAKGSEVRVRVAVKKSLLSWEGIGRSISATENVRALWALGLALLLIAQSFLSCNDDLGSFLSSWTPPWPVALVVVTDISLVFGALLLGYVKSSRPDGDADNDIGVNQEKMMQALNMATRLEFVLQVGHISLKSLQALFVDCSIYIVVLVSGVSLAQIWRPSFCSLVNL